MSGTQNIGEASDNPVAINVTAMVDVIFCLCIFFMCSFKFKQLEGKIESWLPKDKGVFNTPVTNVVLEEIRIFMKWDDASQTTIRQVGNRPTNSDEDLRQLVVSMADDFRRTGKTEVPVILDAQGAVPWRDVVRVMDMCKEEKLEKIEFAAPITYKPPGQ